MWWGNAKLNDLSRTVTLMMTCPLCDCQINKPHCWKPSKLDITAIMVETLVQSLEKLHLQSQSLEDNWLDQILDQPRPRKRVKQDPEDLKRELEEKYLTPSNTFSESWLNKLQQ